MNKTILLIILLCFSLNRITAQKKDLIQGSKLYNQLAYSQAIKHFENVIHFDSTNATAIRMLADCYRRTEDLNNSLKYYSKVVLFNDVRPIEKYYFGQTLMMLGKYDEAKQWLAAFYEDERGKAKANGIENLDLFMNDSTNYIIENQESINTEYSEIGPAFCNNAVLFSSNRYKFDGFSNLHTWTGNDFYKIYKLKEKKSDEVVKFTNRIQSKYNVGPINYDSLHGVLYITRNQTEKAKINKSSDGQIKLGIYTYSYNTKRNKWENEKAFLYNNANYNVAHPTISADGNWLVFASNLPGSIGGMDLWICKNEEGKWSEPRNLGSKINTKGNEVFPFINAENILFFSSDGMEGLGGLDIYYAALSNGNITSVFTTSYPINSMGDDFGFIVNQEGNSGYFASNRNGGKGSDDIYKASILKKYTSTTILEILVLDELNNKPLSNAILRFKNINDSSLVQGITNANGVFSLTLDRNRKYNMEAFKELYTKVEFPITTVKSTSDSTIKHTVYISKTGINLHFKVSSKNSKLPLSETSITVRDYNTKDVLYAFNTSSTGNYTKSLNPIKINDVLNYTIEIRKQGFEPKALSFNRKIVKFEDIYVDTELDLHLDSIIYLTETFKSFNINPIYFDLDKWDIRTDATVELNKIVNLMKEYPQLEIELRSYTDCRASEGYNNDLSDKRVRSTIQYLISKGIKGNRLFGKGYGESNLVNDCGCEGENPSTCTEMQHQLNRRTEFIIRKM